MDNFRSGFSSELMDIMSKEAAAAKTKTKRVLQYEKLLADPKTKSLGRKAERGARQVAIGGLAHKLINPGADMASATRSGIGMAGGGAIGNNLAKQMGAKSVKSKIISSFLGSALGIRAMRKGKTEGKSDRELLEMAIKKEK